MTAFTPRDKNYEKVVRGSFARQGAMGHLGVTMHAVAPGSCELQVDYRPELSQQNGYFHGGIVATIADTAGGYAGRTLMAADAAVLTVEFKLNLVAPAAGTLLIARGKVVRPGRTLTVTSADVYVVAADGGEVLCAIMQQTLICLPAGDNRSSG